MFSLPFLFPKTTFAGDQSTVPEIKDYSCYSLCYGGMASPFSIHGSQRMETIKITNKQKKFCSIGRLQRRRRRKNSVICFQNLNFGFNNVTETLHDLSARLIKAENVSLLTNYLKKRNEAANGVPVEEEVKRNIDLDFPLVSDCSFDVSTPRGNLSPAAISCIEQFSRLNGLTGKQMRRMFFARSPQAILVQSDPRHFVEYCCFKYLSRCSADFHPCIKDAAFRRLIFITMLAWQQPYANAQSDHITVNENEKIIGKDAFTRIAPAVAGVADKPTAHYLYKALTNSNEGLSFIIWETYLSEILRIHEERSEHHLLEGSTLKLDAEECVLCVGANKRQPIQMWNDSNVAWPGRLTLTNMALYFEPNGIMQYQKAMKLDLRGHNGKIQKRKVGPFGMAVLDTAIVVSSDDKSEPWTLDFVDLSGGRRREAWFSFIYELLSVYSFISEYGPVENDPFIRHMYGSLRGSKKAVASAVNGIARVQAIQSMLGKLVEHPGKLLQFSYLQNAPFGELVKQSLAVGFWGGHLEINHRRLLENDKSSINTIGTGFPVVDVDGSIYLQRWMRSSTWSSSTSSQFWKHKPGGKGLIIGKDLVVGDASHLDRSVKLSLGQSEMLERTRATIDGALVKGIPSNIDLFKELMLPFTLLSISIRKLRKWENPQVTVLFLASCLLVIFKHWLRYFVSILLMTSAGVAFILHNVKSDGEVEKVTIREPPPSNTLQKIIALKEALTEVEIQIQNVNIGLLKLRSLVMAGHPQGRNLVALALLGSALVLLLVPFQYVLAFVLIDQFTSELEFRRGMVLKWNRQVSEWWEAIPASPVAILPLENQQPVISDGEDANPSMKGERSSLQRASDLLL